MACGLRQICRFSVFAKVVNLRVLRTSPCAENCERGTSFLELAICLPFIVILIIGTVELGRLMNDYMAVNRAVYDAARKFASMPGAVATLSDTSGTVHSNHQIVHDRIRLLVERNGVDPGRINRIQTQVVEEDGNNLVRVGVRIRFDLYFAFSKSSPLTFLDGFGTRTTMPYLFAETVDP